MTLSVEELPRLNLDAEGAFEIDWTRFDAATHILGPEEKLLRHLELVSEIEFGLSWIPMDGLRLVDDKGI